jgi:gamma-glutamyltranspeptidase / glutathione hydrolase
VLDRFGTMSWTQATEEMFKAFRDGIPAASSVASSARSSFTSKNTMTRPINVQNRAELTQGGPNMKEGYFYLRTGSVKLIKEMSEAEQKALAEGADRSAGLKAARDEFYRGNFAKTIDQFSRDTGGYTRYSDYYAYYGKWYEQEQLPHTTFMGYDFWTDVPVSQASMDLMMFNLIELCKVATGKEIWELGYYTPDYIMFIVQCFDLVFADRWQYFGDPQFVDVPYELFTKQYAAERIKLVDIKKRFDKMPTPGDPRKMKNTLDGWKMWDLPPKIAGSTQKFDLAEINDETVTDTTHGGMMDAAGNVFSINPSDSGPMVPGYGVAIGQRSRQFTYDPALPSCIAPGKRPETTPCVLIGSKDGEGFCEIGTVSGDSQCQAHVQIMLNYLVWGMNPQVAIDQPRFNTGNYLSWFTPHIEGYYYPSRIVIARGAPAQMYTMLGVTDDDWPGKATTDELKKGAPKSLGAAGPALEARSLL